MESHFSNQIEELQFSADWQAELLQFSPGPLGHRYSAIDLGAIRIEYIQCAAAVQVFDVHRAPYLSFGVVTNGDAPSKFLAHPIERGDAIVWRPQDSLAYEYITPTNLSGYIIMVSTALAEERGWSLKPTRLMKSADDSHKVLTKLSHGLASGHLKSIKSMATLFLNALETAYGSQLFIDQDTSPADASAEVFKLVQHAKSYLRNFDSDELENIDALANIMGVSRRSLYRAFQQWPGVGPARYSRFLRLAAARRDLLERSPQSSSVMAISLEHGFHHTGRFAAEYRDFFGESPVATLRKANLV